MPKGRFGLAATNGYLLVSDTQVNHIVKWSPTEGRSVWLEPSGYDVGGIAWNPAIREPGTNGLILDAAVSSSPPPGSCRS